MKFFALNSNKYPSSHYQPSAYLIKWTLLKSPDFHFHASQFTKRLSFMTLEGNNLIQIKKWWYSIFLHSENICQQTRAGHHTNHSE